MSNNNIEKIRHSLSHLMAMAILKKFPKTVLAIGPTIENGFYYDFDLPKGKTLSENDFAELEKTMKELIVQDLKFEKLEFAKPTALKKVKGPFKKELIKEHGKAGKKLSFYQTGKFLDLCAGPHVNSTKEINPDGFKLTKVAGAYWRGNEKNKMLTRIYGVAFATKQELDKHLQMLAEAEKRDHRILGKDLELFIIDPLVGAGLPLFLPKGTIIYNSLVEFLKEEQLKRGYQYVTTPHLGNLELYKTSGHYPYYKDSQYSPLDIDGDKFLIKPMNCPHHIAIYKSKKHSYKELPIRLAECGTVYRYEKSGELSGLVRVRGFTIDDAHIFTTEEQIEREILSVADLVLTIFKVLNFKEYRVRIGTRDPKSKKYVGNEKTWQKAEEIIIKAIKDKFKYSLEAGEAAFYGPKIDFVVKDVLGREWQLGTVQLDFNLPERFDLTYVDKGGKEKRPVIIHRAPFGSLERFIGILIEHFAGAFPLWLSPIQVLIMSVGSAHEEFVKKLAGELKIQNIRVKINIENETIANKIRQAEQMKIPYMLVIGDKEVNSDKLAVRIRGRKELWIVEKNKFIGEVKNKIKEKRLDL